MSSVLCVFARPDIGSPAVHYSTVRLLRKMAALCAVFIQATTTGWEPTVHISVNHTMDILYMLCWRWEQKKQHNSITSDHLHSHSLSHPTLSHSLSLPIFSFCSTQSFHPCLAPHLSPKCAFPSRLSPHLMNTYLKSGSFQRAAVNDALCFKKLS